MHVARLIWLSGLATLPRMQHLREHDARDKCTSHHSGPHRDLACCIMHDTVICSAWVADFLCFPGAKEANVEELMTEPDFMLDLPSFTDICDLDIIGPEDRIRANQAKSGQVVEKKSAEDFATKTICSGMLQGKMLSLKIVTSWPLVMINDRKTGGGLAFLGFLSTHMALHPC